MRAPREAGQIGQGGSRGQRKRADGGRFPEGWGGLGSSAKGAGRGGGVCRSGRAEEAAPAPPGPVASSPDPVFFLPAHTLRLRQGPQSLHRATNTRAALSIFIFQVQGPASFFPEGPLPPPPQGVGRWRCLSSVRPHFLSCCCPGVAATGADSGSAPGFQICLFSCASE